MPDDAEVEHTDFIPVDHENLRWSEDSAHGGANNGHVGHSRTRSGQCLTGNPDGCRASVLRSLRVDVLVKSLRLHRWGIRTATDATGAASDAAASASDADLADDWSAMSSDEVDLFFPDESEDNEDGTVGETVILQLQA